MFVTYLIEKNTTKSASFYWCQTYFSGSIAQVCLPESLRCVSDMTSQSLRYVFPLQEGSLRCVSRNRSGMSPSPSRHT